MFSIFFKVAIVFGAVGFGEDSLAVLHIILELATVPLPVLVEVLAPAMLFVFAPIADVKLAADIVVLSLTVLHAVEELSLIPLAVLVNESPLSFQLSVDDASWVSQSNTCEDGAIGQLRMDLFVLGDPDLFFGFEDGV